MTNLYKQLISGISSSRFYKYLISYCFITVVIISVASAIAYGSIYITLNSQVEMSNISSLMQLRDIVDSRLKEMERIAVQITSNQRLNASIIEIEGYDSVQVMKELQNYSSSSDFIKDVALYYKHKHSDRLFASSGLYSLDNFFALEYNFESYDKKAFLEDINKIKTPIMKSVSNITRQKTSSQYKLYMYPIPANSGNPFGFVIFIIEESKFYDLLDNILHGREGSVFILNNNELISSSGKERGMPKIIEVVKKYPDSGKVNTININGYKLSLVNIKSEYNGWQYVSAIAHNQYMEIAYKSSVIFNVLILILLAVGLIIAYFLASKNYKPIKLLTDKLKDQLKDKTSYYDTDEISYITKTFEKVTSENTGLLNELQSVNFMIKEHFLINLIMGKYENNNEIESHGIFSGINIKEYNFVVMVFLLDDADNFENNHNKAVQNLIRSSMVNTSETFAKLYGLGFGINLIESNGITLILGIRKCYTETFSMEDFAASIKECFKNDFGLSLTIGIGNIYDNIIMSSQSFAEANRAAAYRFVKGTNNILFYKDIDFSSENTKYKYPAGLETQLVNAIRQGQRKDIEKLINEVLQNVKSQNISPEAVQCICFGIISTITKTLDEANFSTGAALDVEIVELFTAKFDTIECLTNQMAVLCRNLCSHIENQKESKNFALRDKITGYVAKNYTKCTISLESIAEKFGFSPSYITRYFKDQTGTSLMKYIDNLRMEKAKELLKTTDMTSKKIIELIGYTDETNFIRKFKNSEGLTPAQYRGLSNRSPSA